ncbi:hypothetical protein CRENBAI_004747 [Crenichthys baileyi]|uniref:Uncharacterized protein n=1 Tax=Crenichthys baileyi TaxID=28760 RepID=A0AAV9RV15_9TELE
MKLQATEALLVLMLLNCSAPSAAEQCDLPPKMQQEDLHRLSEVRWVLVEAFADSPAGEELIKKANSSIVEMKLKDNNKSFLFIERNIVAGNCLVLRGNMSIPDAETSNHSFILDGAGVREFGGVVTPYNDQGRADVHQGCSNCLLIVYHGVLGGSPERMLLIYSSFLPHPGSKVPC